VSEFGQSLFGMQHTATSITFVEKASAYKQIRSPFTTLLTL
jgi:hypothetical protein